MTAEPRVSVVVPVFNAGPDLEPAIVSILRQTLPRDQVEAIFVDDGSTDETPARLDRLAAEEPATVRVIHTPPSGAPGRPRNIGLAAARGDYVQFLDADDELALDALERLVAMADRNTSDVVVEKFASATIRRSQRLFQHNVERTTLAATPSLLDSSLALAKLFRRSFLQRHDISFPEGWRLMEDQAVVLEAYARAGAISILADHPCYFFRRRGDGDHLTAAPIEPESHIDHLRVLLDLVHAEYPAGPLRDRAVRRLVRAELFGRLAEPAYQALPEGSRAVLFEGARALVLERVAPAVIAGLGAVPRVRSDLLAANRSNELLTLAERMDDVEGATRLDRLTWRDGVLVVGTTIELAFASGGRPVIVERRDKRSFLDPAIADELLGHPLEVTEDLARRRVDVILRARSTSLEWHIKGKPDPFRPIRVGNPETTADFRTVTEPVGATVRATIDPLAVEGVAVPLARGTWDVLIRLATFGFERTERVGGDGAAKPRSGRPAILGTPPRIVVPVVDATGLRLEVDPPMPVVVDALARRPQRTIRDGDRLIVELAMAAGPGVDPWPAELVVQAPDGFRSIPAVVRPWLDGVVLEARPTGLDGFGSGPWPIAARFGGLGGAELPLGTVRIEESRVRLEGLRRITTAERVAATLVWQVTRLRRRSADGRAAADRWLRRRFGPISRRLRAKRPEPAG